MTVCDLSLHTWHVCYVNVPFLCIVTQHEKVQHKRNKQKFYVHYVKVVPCRISCTCYVTHSAFTTGRDDYYPGNASRVSVMY